MPARVQGGTRREKRNGTDTGEGGRGSGRVVSLAVIGVALSYRSARARPRPFRVLGCWSRHRAAGVALITVSRTAGIRHPLGRSQALGGRGQCAPRRKLQCTYPSVSSRSALRRICLLELCQSVSQSPTVLSSLTRAHTHTCWRLARAGGTVASRSLPLRTTSSREHRRGEERKQRRTGDKTNVIDFPCTLVKAYSLGTR